MKTQPQSFSYAIKDFNGFIVAVVTCPTARQAFWSAVAVIKNMNKLGENYYGEPIEGIHA